MAASLQVPYATGKVLRDVDNGEAHVQRYGGFVNLTVTEGDGGGWLDGLREVGGINIPVASALLVRLSVLFIYFILFCALAFPDKDFHDNLSIALFRRVLLTIVTALTVVALLGFALDLSTALWRDPGVQAYISAGPLGLLIGGAMLLWLRACWRIGTDNTRRKRRRSLRIKGVLAAYVLTLAVVLVVYGLALKALQVNLLSHWAVVPIGTILLSACIPILVTQLLGDHRLTSYLVSAGLLAAALTATIIWPYLWYSGFKSANGQLLVNAVGKYVYLTAASLTIIGLCILFWRATTKLVSKERRWLRSLLRLMTIGIGIAGLWDVAANADISDPHSSGSDALNLFGLFDALPQLLDWMLIVLTIVVLIRLPATPSARRVARRIVAPVLVLILYWNGTWLYLPVTFALGLVLVTRVLLPQKLLSKTRRARPPEESLEDAIVAWRRADFAAGQQKALAGATDALRDLLVKGDSQGYRRGYETIGKAQEDLAREHDDFERKARAAKNTAFNHNGEILDRSTAATGAVLGAVFGIIPATVSLLTSQPPDNSGYPMLDFLGSTAWTLLFWPTIGWFVGYLLPLIRGDNGTEKALWIFFVAVAAGLPMDIIWNSGHDWTLELLNTLELFAFFMLLTVSLSDLKTLRAAGMNATDWVRVHNWRFTVTWSTALIAAIGTAAVTFLSSAAADFSNQTVANITGPSSGQAGNHAP